MESEQHTDAQMTAGESRLAKAVEDAIRTVMDASPQKECARAIKHVVAAYPCKSTEAQTAVVSGIARFARQAEELIERGDFAGLERAIGVFDRNVREAAEIMPPTPAVMPPLGGDLFAAFGWSSKEQISLRSVLSIPLLGVKKGDRVVSIDASGALLASGLKFTREQIFAAGFPWAHPGTADRPSPQPGRSGLREIE
jgi:hypothetical protein